MMMSEADMQFMKDMTANNKACIATAQEYLQGSPADHLASVTAMARTCITDSTAENTKMAAMMKTG